MKNQPLLLLAKVTPRYTNECTTSTDCPRYGQGNHLRTSILGSLVVKHFAISWKSFAISWHQSQKNVFFLAMGNKKRHSFKQFERSERLVNSINPIRTWEAQSPSLWGLGLMNPRSPHLNGLGGNVVYRPQMTICQCFCFETLVAKGTLVAGFWVMNDLLK